MVRAHKIIKVYDIYITFLKIKYISNVSMPNTKPAVAEMKKEKSNSWALLDKNHKEIGRFTGAIPSVAARKAASKGHKDILLRRTGEKTQAKRFEGSIVKTAPKTVTRGNTTYTVDSKPKTKYIGIVKL